jgi:hypothetical protein
MALDTSRYFEELHMKVLIAIFVLADSLAIVVLAVVAAHLGYCVIHGIRVYFRFRGTRRVICPETHQAAMVEVAARSMGMQAIVDEPCLRLSECSRWPMRGGCGQGCLRQIEARPWELRFSAICRGS